MIAIICAAVLVVAAVGGFTAYRFLHSPDAAGSEPSTAPPTATALDDASTAARTLVPARVGTAQSIANPAPLVQPSLPETAAPAAPPTTPAPTDEEMTASATEAAGNDAADASAPNRPAARQDDSTEQVSVEAVALPPEPKNSRPPAPARVAGPDMSGVALNLVRKGEADFKRQDYSAAMANARAALQISPNLARASRLLQEAERSQQQAMNSISIK